MSVDTAPTLNAGGWLDTRWRQFATGFCFAVFGLGGIVFGLTLFPLVCLPARNREVAKRRAQWIVHRWFRLFSQLMRAVGVISWEIHGAEKLQTRGQMIIANHPSLIDVVLLIGYMPQVDCIVKEALFRNPFTRLPIRWAGYISNGGGSNGGGGGAAPTRLVDDCAATLKAGNSLLIFPEGTRSVPGRPLQIPHGTARIALESGAPIMPVTITCEPIMLTKNTPWYRVPPRPGHFCIRVGEPYSAGHYLDGGTGMAIAARRLARDWTHYFSRQIEA